MKKITLCLMLILALIIVPGVIFAAEGDVAQVGNDTYATLEKAVAVGGNVTLLKSVELNETINITGDVVIDLKNFNITSTADPVFNVSNGSIEIKGSGKIKGSVDVFYLVGNTVLNGEAIKAEAKIGANVEVVSETSNCIYLKGNGAKADVYGNLKTTSSKYAAIQGNGTKQGNIDNGNTVINIYEGANVVSVNNLAIYHPQSGALNVYGGNIEGTTGIEMRAGTLTVTGGEIKGTWSPSTSSPNGNGSTTLGAGIALSQHSTTQETKVVVKDGTIKGYTALFQGNVQGNDDEAVEKVSVEIKGGKFEAIEGGTEAVHSENKTGFITGGTFTSDVSEYVSADLGVKTDEKGNFVTAKKYNININTPENGIITVNKTEAIEGEEVTVTLTPNEGYILRSVSMSYSWATQENYEKIFKFIMPDENVDVTAVFEKIKENITIEAEIPNEIENAEEIKKNVVKTLKEFLEQNDDPFIKNRNLVAELVIIDWNKTDMVDDEQVKEWKENFETVIADENLNLNNTSRLIHVFFNVKDKDTGEGLMPLEISNQEIKLNVSVLEELPKVAEGYEREFYIIGRIEIEHTFIYDVIDAKLSEDGKTLEFTTDKLGLFNVAYRDVKKEEVVTPPADNEGPIGESGTGVVEPGDKPTVDTEKEELPDPVPTGDNVIVYAVFAVVAIAGMAVTIKMKRK